MGCACGGRSAGTAASRGSFESFLIALGKKSISYSQDRDSAHDTYELFVEHNPEKATDVRLDRVNPVSGTVLEKLRPTEQELKKLREGWRPAAAEMRSLRG